MNGDYHDILNPLGEPGTDRRPSVSSRRVRGAKPVIGLLDNSKPNVALFLQAMEEELRERDRSYEFIKVTKPRSAMACPDVDALAEQCDYVINAVAD